MKDNLAWSKISSRKESRLTNKEYLRLDNNTGEETELSGLDCDLHTIPLALSGLSPDQQLVLTVLRVSLEVVLLQHGHALVLVLLVSPDRLLLVVSRPPAGRQSVREYQRQGGAEK